MTANAPNIVKQLVDRFQRNIDEYKSDQYKEAHIRQEFLDPFFEALGWDVQNTKGWSEAYKEVIHEDSIKSGGGTRAPDYCFRIGGVRKFFVEAKRAKTNIKNDPEPAFQVRRYAWSAKLTLSIATDFEELSIYDCRIKPNKSDKAAVARLDYYHFTQYIDRWEELLNLFSPQAIQSGNFDKFAEAGKSKKGTEEVDAAFLEEIDGWRVQLAKNIALRNLSINDRDLNSAVQKTIDRIVFLRICEDRGIEPYGQLKELLDNPGVYKNLCKVFQAADDKYNSGLFHFHKEKGRSEYPDTLTPTLTIDDQVLHLIIRTLYYPESPYEFSVLPADILGHVYEQFLGKVIRLTSAHRAVVEYKPEVKKAGGVYYTPSYIVDHMVQCTLGELVTDKSLKRVENLRILDPACGSGSFLLSAYQYLLDWYLSHYQANDPDKWARARIPKIYSGSRGQWLLTTTERKRILIQHIYGVDVDPQAVEVTKLSLLLKVLEGESNQTLREQLKLFQERALPDLGKNIRCGNTLIEPRFFLDQTELFSDEEIFRVNPFDWKKEFADIISDGGFDVIIGNPPYVDIKALPPNQVRYLFDNFSTANNRVNLFAAFVEAGTRYLKEKSFRFSMIVPTAILSQTSYQQLRELLLDQFNVNRLVRLPNESFGSAAGEVKVDTVIVVLGPKGRKVQKTRVIAYSGYERILTIDPSKATINAEADQQKWLEHPERVWAIGTTSDHDAVLGQIEADSTPLLKVAEFSLGLTPYDKYKGHTPEQIEDQVFHSDHQKDQTFRPLLAGNDVTRYAVEWNRQKWISYGPWLGAPRDKRFFTQPRILVKQIIDWTDKRIWAAFTADELYNTQNAFNLLSRGSVDLHLLLGIINSKLMSFFHRKRFLEEYKMRFQKILIKDCKTFPIRRFDQSNKKTDSDLPVYCGQSSEIDFIEEILAVIHLRA